MQLRTCLVLAASLALAACGSGSSSTSTSTSPTVVTTPTTPTTPSTPATASTVDVPPPDNASGEYGTGKNAQSSFTPDSVTVTVGATVTWTNHDITAHTTTNTGAGGGWNGTLAPGASFSRVFPTAGTFDYRCTIHPQMSGTITVK